MYLQYLNSRNPVKDFPYQSNRNWQWCSVQGNLRFICFTFIKTCQSARQNMLSGLNGYGLFITNIFYSFWQDLTYKIKSFTSDIGDREKQRQIFRKAFKLWSDATNLRINENRYADDKDVDIHISFETGYHSDAYPFDGAGGTLAHAFYPHNNLGKWTNKPKKILTWYKQISEFCLNVRWWLVDLYL